MQIETHRETLKSKASKCKCHFYLVLMLAVQCYYGGLLSRWI